MVQLYHRQVTKSVTFSFFASQNQKSFVTGFARRRRGLHGEAGTVRGNGDAEGEARQQLLQTRDYIRRKVTEDEVVGLYAQQRLQSLLKVEMHQLAHHGVKTLVQRNGGEIVKIGVEIAGEK